MVYGDILDENYSMNTEQIAVLIVDDEEDIRFLLTNLLTQKQISSRAVEGLTDAKVFLENQQPGLIFLDNRLNDGKGVSFIPYIKEKYPDTRVIMISAYDSPADQYEAINNGADKFLSKPLRYDQLREVIATI
jgi:DNA-binding NtrC family response regulator